MRAAARESSGREAETIWLVAWAWLKRMLRGDRSQQRSWNRAGESSSQSSLVSHPPRSSSLQLVQLSVPLSVPRIQRMRRRLRRIVERWTRKSRDGRCELQRQDDLHAMQLRSMRVVSVVAAAARIPPSFHSQDFSPSHSSPSRPSRVGGTPRSCTSGRHRSCASTPGCSERGMCGGRRATRHDRPRAYRPSRSDSPRRDPLSDAPYLRAAAPDHSLGHHSACFSPCSPSPSPSPVPLSP